MAQAPAYERDPYLTELATEVISTGEASGRTFALLDDTLFYPEGGGQPADAGRLNGIDVVDVQSSKEGIQHYLAKPVDPGPAELELDWGQRYDHMQQHTAQHLLSAIAADRFGWTTTSFHLGSSRCDIELDTSEIGTDELAWLEEEMMRVVRAAVAVTTRYVSADEYTRLEIRSRGLPETHSGDVRLVEISGIDITTCGGTHLRSTSEIEAIRLGPTEPMRGGTRLHWLAGARLRRRLAELETRNRDLRRLFETSGDELVEAASAKLGVLKDAHRALRRAREELAASEARGLAVDSSRFVEAHYDNVDGGFLQRVARDLIARAPAKAALLTAAGERGLLFVVACGDDSELDVGEAGSRVAEILGGRGGGSSALFQGRADAVDRRPAAVAWLEEQVDKKTGGRSPR